MRYLPAGLLLVALLSAASCDSKDALPASAAKPVAAPAAPAPKPDAPKPAVAAAEGPSADEAERELPGFPMGELTPFQRQELVTAAKDEFCYCGCPHTISGCLKEHKECKHALRAATVLAGEIASGANRTEALLTYTRYHDSFKAAKRQTLELADLACKGPADAKVTLVEFADFECGHCAAARPMLDAVLKARSDVRLCFKHFPLPAHANAMPAAQAAEFARRKGKFWELQPLLFEHQRKLSPDKIKELVAQVGLDPKELVRAVESDELTAVVEKHKAEGRAVNLQGTPTIFVNGRQMELALSPELLSFTIDDELEWQGNGGKWNVE